MRVDKSKQCKTFICFVFPLKIPISLAALEQDELSIKNLASMCDQCTIRGIVESCTKVSFANSEALKQVGLQLCLTLENLLSFEVA